MTAAAHCQAGQESASQNAPVVSVIVPAYNAAATVCETIDSVLRQSFADFELIVIDDGSTDDTAERVRAIGDPRLKIFSYANSGLATARNRGVEQARGEFISFIDADDMWTPDKLDLQVRALRQNPEAAFAYSWTVFVDKQGRYLFAKQPCYFEGRVFADLLRECFLASGSNMFLRRSCALAVGGFDAHLAAAQDWDFCLRIAARWPFAVVRHYQIIYRLSEGAMSGNVERCEQSCEFIAKRACKGNSGLSLSQQQEVLANVKQYAAFLYLTRAAGLDFDKKAGHKLAEYIGACPRVLLAQKAWHLLLAWTLCKTVPFRLRRHAVMSLLRIYGRWMMIRHTEVRQFVRTFGKHKPMIGAKHGN